MAKCKVCGSELKGNFCSNCGAKADMNVNVLNIDLNEILKNAASMQEMLVKSGAFPKDLNAVMSGMFSNLGGAAAGGNQQKEKMKEARLAIINHMCPDCGSDFKDGEIVCKKCGALLDLDHYSQI